MGTTMSLLLEKTKENPQLEDEGDSKKFSHYAEKNEVTEGYVLGTPVLAICGKIFIPSRDPNKFPICPICKKIADSLFLLEQ
jgi:hypothetical protein